jgi:GTPase SAR1 family protein
MRIAISGCQNSGKSTLVSDFLKQWPKYKKSAESYRSLIREGTIKNLNKQVTAQSQWDILQSLIKDQEGLYRRDKVIFDRCTLDNLVYSLWSEEKSKSDIDAAFIQKCIPLVRESMKKIDIIFFIPRTNVVLKDRTARDTDPEYIKEIDNIFKQIAAQHLKGQCAFFPKDDAPPIIEIFGSPEERIEMIKYYLDPNGDLIDEKNTILTSENIKLMEELLQQQKSNLKR